VHVVSANKRPLTVEHDAFEALRSVARASHRSFHYTATVGAGLPIIDTLGTLLCAGDRVRLIEGSFSGTLGFVLEQLVQGAPLSRAVREAKRLGYTETDPREDLSGVDVVRKSLILARELGLKLDLGDIQVAPFVPASLLEQPGDAEAFLRSLEALDAPMAWDIERHRRRGEVPRYLARIAVPAVENDDVTAEVSVGLRWVAPTHPAAQLHGTDAQVAFTTARYAASPLVVQGAGAGGAVTAAGVLADVIAIAQALRVNNARP
jgi:aspartokinase/homoserine dehydrogenase 1